MTYPQADVDRIRAMAETMMAHAQSEEMETRRNRWRAANGLRKPDRAPVWCGMAGVSRELFPADTLECTDPDCRRVEDAFRRHLYKMWVGDDEVFEPWWGVSAVFDCSTEYPFGLPTHVSIGSTDQGGFKYHHPVETPEDYKRVTVPHYTYNETRTNERLARARDLLEPVMPVRLVCSPPLAAQHSVYLEQLRGMDGMLEDLAFRPHLVHRAMAAITEGVLNGMRAAEATGLLTENNHPPMTCSDPLNRDDPSAPVGLHNLWAAANSQEFQVISPQMHEEFLLNYQIPCLQQFGAVQYGCCEDLTHKIDGVLRIPNLRIFVCSYWTDLETLMAAVGTDYTIMWRELSARVMLPDELDEVADSLDEAMRMLQGSYYQVILREVETLNGHTDRLKEWTRLAVAAAERYA